MAEARGRTSGMRGTNPSTERAVTAFMASMRALWSGIPGGVWRESPDLVQYSTGRALPRFNGVAVLGPDADEATAASWLAGLSQQGLPYCILSRPAAPAWVGDLAARLGLADIELEPLMLHLNPSGVAVPDEPSIKRVDPADAAEVALAQQLFAEGFEAPLEELGVLMAGSVLRQPGLNAYVGLAGGEPCTTGFGAFQDGHIGVFNIATPPAHRRRGHGHAVTAHVIAEGVAAGAHTAYLQASEMGYPVYERMGFRTVEAWPSYYPRG